MFSLIIFSPAIVYFAIVGLSELGLLGVSQNTLRMHIAAVGLLQVPLLFGGVIYEAIFRRSYRQPVPRYMYYLIGTLLLLFILSAMFFYFTEASL